MPLEDHVVRRDCPIVLEGVGAIASVALGVAAAFSQGFLRANADDPLHPGWPAGTPGGLGGKFRPKDGSATAAGEAAVRRRALRRAIRALLQQMLALPPEIAANLVPALGEAADIAMVAQLAETFSEFQQLDTDTKAALDFLANGPYSLEDLRVSPASESFSSFQEFKKGLSFLEYLLKRFGAAGDGYDYHHIVEQGGTNADAFATQDLQSTNNIVRIPTLLHEAINSVYSVNSAQNPDITFREQIRNEPFAQQREDGIGVMRGLGIIQE
jgi:hypothetical protein